jgi:hypothetical protein
MDNDLLIQATILLCRPLHNVCKVIFRYLIPDSGIADFMDIT